MKFAPIFLAVALASSAAHAATQTANFTVRLNVTGTCQFSGGGNLDFGTRTSDEVRNGNLVTNEGVLNVKCTKGLPYGITLNDGSNYGDNSRRMVNTAGDLVKYGLYRDTGTGAPFTPVSAVAGTNNTADLTAGQNYSVYANILANANQNTAYGTYTDTVVATLTF